MRRKNTFKRGRIVPVLLAGVAGYLIGGWHPAPSNGIASATDPVALRFPREAEAVSPVFSTADASTTATALATAGAARNAQLALFNPEPMVPSAAAPVSAVSAPATAQPPVNPQNPANSTPSAEPAAVSGQPAIAVPPANPVAPAKSAPLVHHAAAGRPGTMLNDAQIASIKQRLHLTPEQEEMWPAVEAALRRMAYAHIPEHRRGAGDSGNQVAAVDPNSVEGLKSAAVPLILSFNDEQKQEVRSLVHVMGLDQLASQF